MVGDINFWFTDYHFVAVRKNNTAWNITIVLDYIKLVLHLWPMVKEGITR